MLHRALLFALLLVAYAVPTAVEALPAKHKPSVSTAVPPSAAEPVAVALPPAVTAEAPPAPGALILAVDADSDDATVGGQAASLKRGENRLALPAGNVAYDSLFSVRAVHINSYNQRHARILFISESQ